METVFGNGHSTVYPLVCGFETDEDALVLHGSRRRGSGPLDHLLYESRHACRTILAQLYPDMPGQMRQDLLPLVQGNIAHIAGIRKSNRALDIEHREWVIGIGRGFDWMHMPNLALIIGPYSPDLADPIRRASGIIAANMQRRPHPR